MRSPLEALDHLIYAVDDLASGIDRIERLLGTRPAIGGRHPRWGTHNALLSLGEGRYFEVVAIDPQVPRRPQPFGLEQVDLPRLTGWMIGAPLPAASTAASASGFDPGAVEAMERVRPDGRRVAWRLAVRMDRPGAGLVPALIDWEGSAHPSRSTPAGTAIESLRLEHPQPREIERMLAAVGVAAEVGAAPRPRIVALLRGASGALVEIE